MKNLYLDIDGVLLTKQNLPANHLEEFLKFATENFNCYWLTTHCKGDSQPAIDHLRGKINETILEYAKKIKPTNWGFLKTEAINFDEEFLWLDDYVMGKELEILERYDASKCLIKIDLISNPNQLKNIVEKVTNSN